MNESSDQIANLLRDVGARELPADSLVERAKQQAKQEWSLIVARRRRSRFQMMSLAAGVLLAVVVWFNYGVTPAFNVELVQGENVQIDNQVHVQRLVKISVGSRMRVNSPVRLMALKNVDLRLAENTEVEWLGADHVLLSAGALYVDTHGQENFHVDTQHASIRDIGTRYLVVVEDGKSVVAVREGKTEVSGAEKTVSLVGDGFTAQTLQLDRPEWKVIEEPASHDRWQWISQVSPNYENLVGEDLLNQLSRDVGKQLIFASPGAKASIVRLHRKSGSFEGIRPGLVLRALVEGSGLELEETDSKLIVSIAQVR